MANREQLYRYRGNRCSHCGKSVEDMVDRYGTFNRMFEFHHVNPNRKNPEYPALMQRTISAEQIEEVDKCLLLCRECHGIVHAQDIEGSIVIQSSVGGRVVSQELTGWFVANNAEKTLRFLSNERNMLQPCVVTLGTGEPEEYFVLELIQENRLLNWLRSIEMHRRIKVISVPDSKLLLEISHVADRRANVRMALGLPILTMDFDVSEGESSFLWLRNGMVLTKEGDLYSKGQIKFLLNIKI